MIGYTSSSVSITNDSVKIGIKVETKTFIKSSLLLYMIY